MLALLAAAVLLAGCGAAGGAAPQAATLVLDFTPNPVHTGVYTALANHFDQSAGVSLRVIAPSASTDSIKLLETGRASFAILDIHDLAIARERGADIVGIMAIVQRPLASVLAGPALTAPRRLEGATVGITGVPSDTAVLDSIVSGDGGNPRRLHTITIGFNAVPALLSGKVGAAIGFWNDEGITLAQRRPGFHVFRVDDFGAPPYPELVLCATATMLRQHRALARAVVRALQRGYEAPNADSLERLVPGLDPALVSAELAALKSAFRASDGRVGELNIPVLKRWSAWEVKFGIVRRAPDVHAMFDTSFATS